MLCTLINTNSKYFVPPKYNQFEPFCALWLSIQKILCPLNITNTKHFVHSDYELKICPKTTENGLAQLSSLPYENGRVYLRQKVPRRNLKNSLTQPFPQKMVLRAIQ